ncbi:MAG: CRISPR-associated endonuclease Cas2 [Candidatus Kerfeldbacteria bacterium]|nr:CRISPR-associated endonuclease Cas2 [Candidatus Kerfeldbacteria bacterium]
MIKSRLPVTKILLGLLAFTGRKTIDFLTLLQDIHLYRGIFIRGRYEYVQEFKKLQRENYARQTLYSLRHSRYVVARRTGNRLMVHLTDKGQEALLSFQLRQVDRRLDRRYTVVIFDIPQSERAARRQFRLLLRQGGFAKLQQSVWISQCDVYQLISDLVRHLKLESWVNVFLASDFLHLPKA